MSTPARDLLWPSDPSVLVRVAFLHVGQGSSTLALIGDGANYRVLLIDINIDHERGGIDVPELVSDLLDDATSLDAFVNSHPHSDHLRGVVELSKKVSIQSIWHSGHKPGKDHDEAYKDLQKVIKKVKKEGGTEVELEASKSPQLVGDAEVYVLSPAEYVVDEIENEKPEERYRRIHEQCAVLRIGLDKTWIMIPGDADRDAWEKHITKYHKKRLPSVVLAAAHHGSRTFFTYDEKDEPYRDALDAIDPTYVVISAPTADESPHNHPHEDAVELYEDKTGADNVLHTGENRYSFICDIFRDGKYSVYDDKGELCENYSSDSGDSEKEKAALVAPAIRTRVDQRPMGRQ